MLRIIDFVKGKEISYSGFKRTSMIPNHSTQTEKSRMANVVMSDWPETGAKATSAALTLKRTAIANAT